jgi:beta-glucosidase-like glycosyl hydrolase/CubicO group peptidase (beta-lactamase class C family)
MYLRKKPLRALFLCLILTGFVPSFSRQNDPPFLRYLNNAWVDSVMNTLSPDQKIAQCIWIAGYSNRGPEHEVEVADLIRKYGIGGIVFFQGTPEKQVELTNYYQKISRVPLFISMDAEWGAGMRLQNVEKFPYQMTLGAIKDDSLIYEMGVAVAKQLKRIGVQVNLAPVADINNNPENPVINYRSFGEERENVTSKTIMYTKGMQDHGVLACIKHFPGHGDTNTDSHLDLPLINHSRARLDSVELFPFLNLINEGAGSIMTAHLSMPSLDPSSNLPSTLSHIIITGILKDQMEFKGLIITDAMNMKGVTKYYGPGVADAKALEAGNDIIEFVTDVDAAIRETKKLIETKKITMTDIDLKCRKVLAAKYWSGLKKFSPVAKGNITREISSPAIVCLIKDLYANALTVLNNDDNLIPLKNISDLKIATVAINSSVITMYQKRLLNYNPADTFTVDLSDRKQTDAVLRKLSDYDLVIAGVFNTDQRPANNFGIKPELNSFLASLLSSKKTIVTYFGNPYALSKLDALQKANGLILAYQENDYTQDLSAQLIFGGIGGKGKLPVTINEKWPAGSGINTAGNLRLRYCEPENAGLSSDILNRKIDSIARSGLLIKAYPGCEVMVARKGIVVFQKTYGSHTYDNRIAVKEDDLFDLASVTKISSTLAGLLLLDSQGKFSPDKTLGDYLPYFRNSNKSGLLMKDLLTHQAGLVPFMLFWKETMKKDESYRKKFIRHEYSPKYPSKIADNLYITNKFKNRMLSEIKKSPLGEKKYVYSDLTFIISPGIIEQLTGEKWYEFVTNNIYHKIGAFDIGFNPYLKYPPDRIVPTEYDSLFRKQQLSGTVHDEAAALQGGISGHAGLFATANDLMKLMELYRRMGNYGGEQLISEEVLKRYTKVQFPENNNRRGLGFDKPYLNNKDLKQEDTYPTRGASPESFGHSGYTGTFVWIDPVHEISYVFLANRVYPTRYNNRLSDNNIRTNILQAVYDSIDDTTVKDQDSMIYGR